MKTLLFAAIVSTMLIGCSASVQQREPELRVEYLVPRVFAPRKAERGYNSVRQHVPSMTKKRVCAYNNCNTMDR